MTILNANHFKPTQAINNLRDNSPHSTDEEINNYLKKNERYSPPNNLEREDLEEIDYTTMYKLDIVSMSSKDRQNTSIKKRITLSSQSPILCELIISKKH